MKYCFIILVVLIVFICSFFASISLIKNTLFSSINIEKESYIIINKGYSLTRIINEINKAEKIKHPILLKMLVKITHQEHGFQSGEYSIQPHSSVYSIIEKISLGNTVMRKITIPPGLTNYQTMQKLLEETSLSGEIPQGIPEGSLFPDTYSFQYNDSRISLIKRMQQAAEQKLNKIWSENNKKHTLPFKSIQEAIVLASIVEKEAGKYDNMAKIAGVFINRLKNNIKLQSDPTTIYAISNSTGILKRELTAKDTKIQSKFNTYYIKGLPPTPIANPSIKAFIAVLNPLKTEDLYFIADKNGGHYFSKTLIDHNKYRNITKHHKY